MSEYIEIESEISDDDTQLFIYTNLQLSDSNTPEVYLSNAEMAEGSPVAQTFAAIVGIAYLQIDGSDLLIQREPNAHWHAIVDDISAALVDFFL
ncbi:MAG: hypothetical protein KDE48_10540 [Anaerolineales bacterium]|nr:hypothetical protein [Anaerolineales bacterium]